jgi:hypothetical protein
MNVATSSLFSQLLSLVDRNRFAKLVRETGSERRSKGFASWDHFVAMLFCQLAHARSLREIDGGLSSCEGKLKHLGMAGAPGRSTLSYANAHRSADLFERLFYQVLGNVSLHAPGKKFRFKSKLYSLDSTVIELCASMFDWAKFRATKGAAKLHLLLDHDGHLPCYARITDGKAADVTVAQQLKLPKGSLLVMDRGYNDYRLFDRWTAEGVGFVTRLKKNALWANHEERPVKPGGKIRRDTVGRFFDFDASRRIETEFRRVTVWIEEKGEEMELLTNRFDLSAETIAEIYKQRWQIELFFKAIKQNLRIKTFVGTSANAVRIQIWTALIAMLLLKLLQFRSRIDWSLSNLIALLRWNLFTHKDLWKWIDDPFIPPPEPPPGTLFQPDLDGILPTRNC